MPDPPCLYVLAGTNGSGKSSLAGAMFRRLGADYFNPDEVARRIMIANPAVSQSAANSEAWHQGRRLLEQAITERLTYAFETTLGGNTIAKLLESALGSGLDVRVWYVGLDSPERHIARVRARVAKGGHDIPDEKIRERFHTSRLNLIRLLPRLTELRVFDNSREGDPDAGVAPTPTLILHLDRGRLVQLADLAVVPEWTKPILAAALRQRSPSNR